MENKNQEQKDRPLRIIISRTRNYGWVTRAFLEGNCRWADYVIITDQMSTDGTREICAEYDGKYNAEGLKCRVVLVDDHNMEFKENGGFKMAFAKGRELAAGRDTIYFAMDIDEVLPANWMETDDGRKILESNPGDMFSIAWANIQVDNLNYKDDREIGPGKYTVFHYNGIEWQECDLELHAPHLPYSSWDVEPYAVKDFPLLHFGYYHPTWGYYKTKYLQFVDAHQKRSKSPIQVFRAYHGIKNTKIKSPSSTMNLKPIEKDWLYADFDLFSLIDLKMEPIFVEYVRDLICEDGLYKYRCIDVWDDDMMQKLGIDNDPRTLWWKLLHGYLRITQPYKNTIVVKAIDKVLTGITRYNK